MDSTTSKRNRLEEGDSDHGAGGARTPGHAAERRVAVVVDASVRRGQGVTVAGEGSRHPHHGGVDRTGARTEEPGCAEGEDPAVAGGQHVTVAVAGGGHA